MAEAELTRTATVQHLGRSLSVQVHTKDYIGAVLCRTRHFFEPEILEFVRENFPKQQTVVDVGSNIGNHALYFAAFLDLTKLVCFEPFPPNFELLRQNLAANGFGARSAVYQVGLGDREATVGMRYHPENLGICRLDSALPGEVSVRTLDSFELQDVTLLKIDVEGDDIAVLTGALTTIERSRPTIIIEGEFDRIFPILAPFGYVCVAYWKPYQTYCFVRVLQNGHRS